jgi:hypothetical protein
LGIGIELADQGISVLFGSRGKMGDEGLNQLTSRAAKSLSAAEVRRISLHEIGIEVVLADQKARLIAEPWRPLPEPLEGWEPFDGAGTVEDRLQRLTSDNYYFTLRPDDQEL